MIPKRNNYLPSRGKVSFEAVVHDTFALFYGNKNPLFLFLYWLHDTQYDITLPDFS